MIGFFSGVGNWWYRGKVFGFLCQGSQAGSGVYCQGLLD
jgi:hypothetical protein